MYYKGRDFRSWLKKLFFLSNDENRKKILTIGGKKLSSQKIIEAVRYVSNFVITRKGVFVIWSIKL